MPPHNPDEREHAFLAFIAAVEEGDSLKVACQRANHSWGSIGRWIADTSNTITDPATGRRDTPGAETYASRYARARHISAEAFADKALRTAEGAHEDNVQVARLQVDTYKWRAAMADPKGYGDRKQVEHSGSIGHLHLAALQASSAQRLSARAQVAELTPGDPVAARALIEGGDPEETP